MTDWTPLTDKQLQADCLDAFSDLSEQLGSLGHRLYDPRNTSEQSEVVEIRRQLLMLMARLARVEVEREAA